MFVKMEGVKDFVGWKIKCVEKSCYVMKLTQEQCGYCKMEKTSDIMKPTEGQSVLI